MARRRKSSPIGLLIYGVIVIGFLSTGNFTTPFVILGLIVISIFLVYLAKFLYVYITFRQSTYHQITHNGWFKTKNDTGRWGEYLLEQELKEATNQGARLLFNLYLPSKRRTVDESGHAQVSTTEIDALLITRQGILVFESKSYSGWIFGNERHKNWTQTLPNGKNSERNSFYNPIWQNNGHIEALNDILRGQVPLYNVVVFSERCTLKNVTWTSPWVYVIPRNEVYDVAYALMVNDPLFSQQDVEEIFAMLYPYSQTDDATKLQHIHDVNRAQHEHHHSR